MCQMVLIRKACHLRYFEYMNWQDIKEGKTNRETYMTDIASTIAALLKIQMPNGNVGTVISEVIK